MTIRLFFAPCKADMGSASKRRPSMSNAIHKGTALITGASSGIGAIYADRLARRGHDLILVARDAQRLRAVAHRIAEATGRKVGLVGADLTVKAHQHRIEHILRTDERITLLV